MTDCWICFAALTHIVNTHFDHPDSSLPSVSLCHHCLFTGMTYTVDVQCIMQSFAAHLMHAGCSQSNYILQVIPVLPRTDNPSQSSWIRTLTDKSVDSSFYPVPAQSIMNPVNVHWSLWADIHSIAWKLTHWWVGRNRCTWQQAKADRQKQSLKQSARLTPLPSCRKQQMVL